MTTFIYLVKYLDEEGCLISEDTITIDLENEDESEAWNMAMDEAESEQEAYGYETFALNLVNVE